MEKLPESWNMLVQGLGFTGSHAGVVQIFGVHCRI